MTQKSFFPEMVTRLPEADIPFVGIKGWIFQGQDAQLVFIEAQPTTEQPHSHGAQYQIVLDGEVTVTMQDGDHRYARGDSFLIPNGSVHAGKISVPMKCMAFFEGNRYRPRGAMQAAKESRIQHEQTSGGERTIGSRRGLAKSAFFPEMVTRLPEADLPFEGAKGWILQGEQGQVGFFEIYPNIKESHHVHGDQFGVILDGEMTLYVDDLPRRCSPGDSFFIPKGAPHYGVPHMTVRSVEYFADLRRYPLKPR